jgi:broad specificity phosphatase PhoE
LAFIRYITHPQVRIDLDRPVTSWGLSDVGRARTARLLEQPWVSAIGRVISSDENKAIQTARLLAERLRIEAEVRSRVGENDRSATGPVPPAEFERLADQFFARPHERVRGWESAMDAQSRIAAALADLLIPALPFDIAVVGHGGVGTLWYCHLAGLPIDRRYDQPSQGHYFSVDLSTGRPAHAWLPIDKL